MPVSPGPPKPPDPAVPLVDPTTGRISLEWYRWVTDFYTFLLRVNAAI